MKADHQPEYSLVRAARRSEAGPGVGADDPPPPARHAYETHYYSYSWVLLAGPARLRRLQCARHRVSISLLEQVRTQRVDETRECGTHLSCGQGQEAVHSGSLGANSQIALHMADPCGRGKSFVRGRAAPAPESSTILR